MEILRQFARFFVFAGLAALVNIASRFFFSSYLAMNFTIAVTVAYCLGMLVNFTLNKNFNFPKGPRRSVHEVRTFIVIALVGLLITNLLSHLFVALLKLYWSDLTQRQSVETVAHVAAVGLTAIYSFLGHKYLTFRHGIRMQAKKMLGRNQPSSS